ncbi:MAG: YdcF family protein, partial [Bryobacteraceae bacterium]
SVTPFDGWYARTLAGNWTDSDGDILILLTAEVNPDGIIGPASYWRSVYAVRAWRSGHFKKIVVSGGAMGTPMSLASALAEFLVGNGVPRDAIILEERSTSTHENAVFTAELIGNMPGKKVLMTSDQHMFRASRAFHRAGLEIVPRPIPDVMKRANGILARGPLFVGLLVETAKICYYTAKGWI